MVKKTMRLFESKNVQLLLLKPFLNLAPQQYPVLIVDKWIVHGLGLPAIMMIDGWMTHVSTVYQRSSQYSSNMMHDQTEKLGVELSWGRKSFGYFTPIRPISAVTNVTREETWLLQHGRPRGASFRNSISLCCSSNCLFAFNALGLQESPWWKYSVNCRLSKEV